jgi:hypothetical protein
MPRFFELLMAARLREAERQAMFAQDQRNARLAVQEALARRELYRPVPLEGRATTQNPPKEN